MAQHSVEPSGMDRKSINLTDDLPADREISDGQYRAWARACAAQPDGPMLLQMMGLTDYA